MTLIKQTEQKIKRRVPHDIKLETENVFKHNNPKSFIENYLVKGCPATIQICKNKTSSCYGGANRSILDLYKLTKHYYPEFILEELLNILQELSKVHKIRGFKCHTIKRLVFRKGYGYDLGDGGIASKNLTIGVGLPTFEQLIEELERENRITRRSIKNNRTK